MIRLLPQDYTGAAGSPFKVEARPREWVATGPGKFEPYTKSLIAWSIGDWMPLNPLDMLPKTHHRNKSIYVWPEEGSGIVVALIRREIGYSYGATGTSSMYSDDFEPGGFEAAERHWLYAVKTSLTGLDVVLTPMWATSLA